MIKINCMLCGKHFEENAERPVIIYCNSYLHPEIEVQFGFYNTYNDSIDFLIDINNTVYDIHFDTKTNDFNIYYRNEKIINIPSFIDDENLQNKLLETIKNIALFG